MKVAKKIKGVLRMARGMGSMGNMQGIPENTYKSYHINERMNCIASDVARNA